jgi:hypothetical protein
MAPTRRAAKPVHIKRHPELGRRDRRRLALHRSGQAATKRYERELQWAAARRVAE